VLVILRRNVTIGVMEKLCTYEWSFTHVVIKATKNSKKKRKKKEKKSRENGEVLSQSEASSSTWSFVGHLKIFSARKSGIYFYRSARPGDGAVPNSIIYLSF